MLRYGIVDTGNSTFDVSSRSSSSRAARRRQMGRGKKETASPSIIQQNAEADQYATG